MAARPGQPPSPLKPLQFTSLSIMARRTVPDALCGANEAFGDRVGYLWKTEQLFLTFATVAGKYRLFLQKGRAETAPAGFHRQVSAGYWRISGAVTGDAHERTIEVSFNAFFSVFSPITRSRIRFWFCRFYHWALQKCGWCFWVKYVLKCSGKLYAHLRIW